MKQNKVRRFWLSCLGLALSLIILVPFYTIIINSFKNTREAAQVNLSLPTQWCILENYAEMFQQGVAPTAAGLWQYYAAAGKSALLELNPQDVYYMSLPRKTCKLTRKGIWI